MTSTKLEVQDPGTGQWRRLTGVTDVRMTAGGEQLEHHLLGQAPAGLSLWEQEKLRWAFHAGLRLAGWVMRFAG